MELRFNSPHWLKTPRLSTSVFFLVVFYITVLGFYSCRPKGFISRTKVDGKKYINTCDKLKSEIDDLVEANKGNGRLKVSENDNTQFNYYYLEPGQFEIKKDSLYFRLINDLEYEKYLQKGVAIVLTLNYESQEHLAALEKDNKGTLSQQMIVDQKYFQKNKDPFFYRFPINNKIDGKNISLNVSVVKYDKKGRLKKVFCNSKEVPLGTLAPSCCSEKPWTEVNPQSVVKLPKLEVKDEQYKYRGFTGSLDLIFPMNSTKFDREELKKAILDYVTKYEKVGYKVTNINIDGFASQGGKEAYNINLSKARCEAVQGDLIVHFKSLNRNDEIRITYNGKGEDWDRFTQLVKSKNFADDERQGLLSIASSNQDIDEKEKELRKLKYWKKLIDEVLVFCRHTYISFTFDYQPDKMYVDRYEDVMTVISPELYNVATKQMTISKFNNIETAKQNLAVLNTLIDENENKKPNLYAMRSTYHIGLNNIKSAIDDIEAAQNAEKGNEQYMQTAMAYKLKNAKAYSLTAKMNLMNEYNEVVAKNPNNMELYTNKIAMMDKIGNISGALAEYSKIMKDSKSAKDKDKDKDKNKDAVLFNNRGVAKMKTNRLAEAEADFQEAINVDGKLAEPYFNLAMINAWRGLTTNTLKYLEQAVELNPSLKCEIGTNPVFQPMIKSNSRKFKKFDC
jgi:outer membrane protein OmpA-like peptidoglycan-associated protein